MTTCACYLAAPIASFRSPWAREYFETLPVPPPSTIYGLLLSAVGEPNRLVHQGTELAIGLLSQPTRARIFRTLWRIKDHHVPFGHGENKRPDFQELLIDVRLVVHVRTGSDPHQPPLADRIRRALEQPASVERWGALAMGESTHLVDEFRFLHTAEAQLPARWLVPDDRGPFALPLWADHVGSKGTQFVQCRLDQGQADSPPQFAWIRITSNQTD
ncbi:MAG: type I-MYXAN CRISPR-associated protein Cas5/Cmx5/DevS [Thermomicrobium sp.]|uniref:type I-MYXAN CRISPR-associated protein Cas5/Cmx5/DevS n=1 Tax=Thermomicrobium sp. TaxID=1969469 RepID=UPI001B007302|nr:type I-MYXAN CRISPR-associated protein Cas5/Cmx5/DevS [Thermomicrobium sp.]MBO9359857.1 type I-MYXAN CRISPR-associated protein Cas5/Cmx5/DevS [Thermomicrobium sp.]